MFEDDNLDTLFEEVDLDPQSRKRTALTIDQGSEQSQQLNEEVDYLVLDILTRVETLSLTRVGTLSLTRVGTLSLKRVDTVIDES